MAINHLAPEQTEQFADNIVGFARALRATGMPVGPGAVIDAMNALQVIDSAKLICPERETSFQVFGRGLGEDVVKEEALQLTDEMIEQGLGKVACRK